MRRVASSTMAPVSTRSGMMMTSRASCGSLHRICGLAMLLASDTGQRQGDLLRLPWSSYDGTVIKLRQGKTGAYVSIPVADALKAALDAAPR